ncbi:hypothetical protein TUZN_0459 [Thermoproteus uzoniensis 768-20]|uniref:Uncharacterized protein n=1 Tax=Thermoproteus uzoniensis (strain 768-20) TaxID=999630 RepID=F2L396_THEU7|nr:hypothetical protein [Thermoproteus uzoniensis]AEA11955.1 hypothetical protein TUZN_0459 [Thermoproteus uzoniensis 768-20]
MFVYIMMAYGSALIVLGLIGGEDSLALFGLVLLILSNLHTIASLLRRRRKGRIDEELKSAT